MNGELVHVSPSPNRLTVAGSSAASFGLAEMEAMAGHLAASGLMPGVDTPEAAFALILLCQSEGLHPGAALRYHIIEGRPSMRADAMQAEFQAQGGTVSWLRSDAEVCEAVFSHPVQAPTGVTVRVTLAELDAAGVTKGKYGLKDNWRKWPRQMLRARAVSEGVRMVLPGVVAGIYTPEEVADSEPVSRPAPSPALAPARSEPARASAPSSAPTPAPPDTRKRWERWEGKLLDRWAEAEPWPENQSDKAREVIARQHRIAHGLVSRAVASGRLAEEQVQSRNAKGELVRDPRKVWAQVHQLCELDWDFVRAATLEHLKEHVAAATSDPDGPDAPDADEPRPLTDAEARALYGPGADDR